MDKLTGHGRPYPKFAGEVGQHYEDLDTGDIYECRIASEYSPTHGWPVGGYVWELRAKGEDIQEIYGSGGSGGGGSEQIVIGLFYKDAEGERTADSKFYIWKDETMTWTPVSVADLYDILYPLGWHPNCVLCYGYFESGSYPNMRQCESSLVMAYDGDGGKAVQARGICYSYANEVRQISALAESRSGEDTYDHVVESKLNAKFEAFT